MEPEDQTTNPEPVIEEQEVALPAEEPQLEAEAPADENQEQEPELEDVDFNGNKYRVPKELAPHLMMKADYTRKTQEVAELRRGVEARSMEVQREAEINQELIDDIAQKRLVDARLGALQGLDWSKVDPQDAQRLLIEQMQLSQAQKDLGGRIDERKAEMSAKREQATATALGHAIEALNKPDEKFGWQGKFDQTVSASLTKFGAELGFTNEELANTTHPLMIKTLHLAKIGAETLRKQRTAATGSRPAAEPAARVPTSRASSHTTDPNKMSMEQYAAARKAGRI